jgi:hypothetical protein
MRATPGSLTRRVSLEHIWLIVPLAVSFSLLCLAPLREGDVWWNLKLGQVIAQSRSIPTTDIFSFTASGYPFNVAGQWLSEVLLYALSRMGGLPALVLCQALVGAAIVGLLLMCSRWRGAATSVSASVTLLSWLMLYPYSTVRTQIFSFLCFALFYALLSAYRLGRYNGLGWLPVVMVVWSNLHGAWVMGLVLLGASVCLSVLERITVGGDTPKLRPLLGWGLVTCLATLVNPTGPGIYRYVTTIGNNAVVQQFASEWLPPSLTLAFTWPFFAGLFLLLVALAYSRRRLSIHDLGLLLLFLVLSLRYLRMIPFWAIVLAPELAELVSKFDLALLLPRSAQRPGGATVRRELPMLNAALAVLLALGALVSVPQVRLLLSGAPAATLIDGYFPRDAGDYLAREAEPGARLFNMSEWGGYLIWRLYPQAQVFVDGRIELYPAQVWDDYVRIAQTDSGWPELLQAYRVDYLVLSKDRHGRLIAAAADADWPCIYEDGVAIIFARQGLHVTNQRSCPGLTHE